jgi:hypothetical protein
MTPGQSAEQERRLEERTRVLTTYAQGRTLLDLSREAARAERAAMEALVDVVAAGVDGCPKETTDPFLRGSYLVEFMDQRLWPALTLLRLTRVAAKTARDAVYKV